MDNASRDAQHFLDTFSNPPAVLRDHRPSTHQSTLESWLFPNGKRPRGWSNPRPSRIKQPQNTTPATKLRLATLNCPGVAAVTQVGLLKRQAIVSECKKRRIDILALQETHATVPLQTLSSFFQYRSFQSIGSAAAKGVAFIVFNPRIKIVRSCDYGNEMIYTIQIQYEERKMTLVCVYVPPYRAVQDRLFAETTRGV